MSLDRESWGGKVFSLRFQSLREDSGTYLVTDFIEGTHKQAPSTETPLGTFLASTLGI